MRSNGIRAAASKTLRSSARSFARRPRSRERPVVSPGAILVAGLAVTVGSILQGSVGFGLGMVAAPVLAFLEPQLVPAPLLICAETVENVQLLHF